MPYQNKLSVLGTGNLGTSIIEGVISNGSFEANNIYATRNKLEKISHLKDKGVHTINSNTTAVQNGNCIILAVKPYKIIELLQEIKQDLDPQRHIVISVATGVSITEIEEAIGTSIPIYRAMPNTAIATQESVTCICGNNTNSETDEIMKNLFGSVGEVIFIKEDLMEAATVLGACGIAYVLRFIRAMIQGGIEIGFDSQTATNIVNQTVKGAADLLQKNNLHPEEEIDKVTTPKGCTIVGLNEMEHQGFSSSLIKGIKSSYSKIEK